MKNAWLLIVFIGAANCVAYAQDFVTRGKIEFEIKRNTKRIFTAEQRANMPGIADADLSYRDLVFSGNRSIYSPGRKAAVPSLFVSNGEAYMDLSKKQAIIKNHMIDQDYVYADSIKKVKWKIENETRVIAGWECRKAVGVINDSIYVVAFYSAEIIPQGGPELFTGLPGMILGVAIPRFSTTWFATKIELGNVDETLIAPPSVKKNKQYTKHELGELLLKQYQQLGWWKDATLEKVINSLGGFTL